MNSRHAAALALVGWYLMMPPLVHDKDGHVETKDRSSPPISRWQILYTFDSASRCQTAAHWVKEETAKKLKQQFNVSANFKGIGSAIEHAKNVDQLDEIMIATNRLSAECIATDDPRLKCD